MKFLTTPTSNTVLLHNAKGGFIKLKIIREMFTVKNARNRFVGNVFSYLTREHVIQMKENF